MRPLHSSQSNFSFLCSIREIFEQIMFLSQLRDWHPLWEILDPPLQNELKTPAHFCDCSSAGTDLGFPAGGGANPPGGGASIQIARFSEKLHEIRKILFRRGGAPPLDPATGLTRSDRFNSFRYV